MNPRRRQVRSRIIILVTLCISFGLLLISFISILIVSKKLSNNARVAVENPTWYFTEERLQELEQEEKEAREKARAEKIASSVGIIYLTFDDGPSEHTATLLDTLKKHDIEVTFFVTGNGDDEIIKREYDEGHTVGLHTWSHRYDVVYTSPEAYFDDLTKISARVKNITGEDAKLIRFPGGSSNTVSAKYDHKIKIMSILTTEVINRGYQYFDWNVDSRDASTAKTADEVYDNLIHSIKPGPNVVLQHDTKGYSTEAVERIIEFGLANNYVFLPLDIDAFAAHHGVNN